jgi:hypothetical protein
LSGSDRKLQDGTDDRPDGPALYVRANTSVLITPARIAIAESCRNSARGRRAHATCRASLPMQLGAPVRNAAFLHSSALKTGIILPLSCETVRFQDLAAVVRLIFLMTIIILPDR